MASDNSKRLGGVASFTIDGTAYMLVGDLKYSVSTQERETLTGMDSGYHGYSEKPGFGHIECTLRDNSVVRTATFYNMTNVTVVAITANGKSVSGQGMTCMKAIEVDTADGKFSVRFEGPLVAEA